MNRKFLSFSIPLSFSLLVQGESVNVRVKISLLNHATKFYSHDYFPLMVLTCHNYITCPLHFALKGKTGRNMKYYMLTLILDV